MKRLFLATVLLSACTDAAAPIPEAKSTLARDTAPAGDVAATVAGNTAFAVDLYRAATGDNLVFSPHSISEALAMTLGGAGGETAAQMTATLHAGAGYHAGMDALALALASRGRAAVHPFALASADALWGEQTLAFQAPFLDLLATDYGAGVYLQDFVHDAEGARQTINGWVADQTNDRIENLLQPGDVSDGTAFVLTNAIYFHAAWAEPFDPADTTDGTFAAPGGPVTAKMMHGATELGYAHGDGYDAVAIGYDGGDLEMLVVQPASLAAFEAGLTAATLPAIAAATETRSVTLTLPKFTMTRRTSVKQTLAALGMTDAFDPARADFSGIDGARDISISDVIHEAFIAVDEHGTEAAAATAVIGAGSAAPLDPVTLVVDHPFVFAIRDIRSGAILFLGRVTDPTR